MPSLSNKYINKYVLYLSVIYTSIIIGVYVFYPRINIYLFGYKNISLVDLLSYPYGMDSPKSIIQTLTSNPIQIFGTLFTLLLPVLVNVTESNYKPYFNSVSLAIIMIITLFIIHVSIVRLIIDPETIMISDKFKVNKKTGESYNNIYRGHWITLLTLSPIYAVVLVYIHKIHKKL